MRNKKSLTTATEQAERANKMNFVEPIRDKQTVRDIAAYLRNVHEKYYIMFMIGIYSGLRVSDILTLRIRDIAGKDQIRIREQKTGKEKSFPVNDDLRQAIDEYVDGKDPDAFVVPSGRVPNKAVSREYAYVMIHEAGRAFGLPDLGTHTMRKTFGYHFYLQTKDIVLVMKILNHADQGRTLRYIGYDQSTINDALMSFSYE